MVPRAAIVMTPQGGTSIRDPKSGASPTVRVEPCLVCMGERDERKVRIRRMARSVR
jgi:hypothetical protein